MPPPCCIPLSDSALNVRAQNIAPLQDGASLLGSGSITAIPPHLPASPFTAVQQAIGAVFFRRSRLFFREAAFFSGGEGCEWRAPRATVGESGDKAENEFSGFIPLAVPRKGESPHIPAPRLFIHFHTTKPQKRNIPYWYCLQCTPSLTLPPSSLKCLQKSNPNIYTKCFRCFKCFGCFRCFMFAFGPQNRPILVQIRTKPTNS